jgi:hypothetical protein
MSSCWHFSFSIFSQYLSVQSMEFGWDLDFGVGWGAGFLLVFLFLFWDTWSPVWALERLDFPGRFVSFSFSLLEYLLIHTSDGCVFGSGKGRDGTVELKINLD